jgi:hypothetical protein
MAFTLSVVNEASGAAVADTENMDATAMDAGILMKQPQ